MTQILARVGLLYASGAALLLAFGWISEIEDGPVAGLQILAPHVALACLPVMLVAIIARSRALAVALAVTAILFGARFGGEWWSLPTTAGPANLRVATWNVEVRSRTPEATVELLRGVQADVIGLQELTPGTASTIAQDPVLRERFPFRELGPNDGSAGIGLLSRYPIGPVSYGLDPVRLEARIALPEGVVVVLNAHAYPVRFGPFAGLPISMDPTQKNARLQLIRDRVDELEASGDPVLLIGDFNTAPTERAFGRLTAGLRDAHEEVGLGPGWTWRPARVAFLGIGLLRIDLILSTPNVVPVGTAIACPPTGDHCLVSAALDIDR
jgi:vancomycin resistance protein VanJ